MSVHRILPEISLLDTHQFGLPRTGAAYLIHAPAPALIDTGTAIAGPLIERATSGTRLRYIFVTHVHLDHAGGAGYVSRCHPDAVVVVHPLGAPHLTDPRRLVEGTKQATGRMFPHYGEPMAIDPHRLHPAQDGETFALGDGRTIEAVFTPGHAPHHVCYIERRSGLLFTGDALGNHAQPIGLPLTVPPRLDRAASFRSFARLRRAGARAVAYAHFGIAVGRTAERIDGYQLALDEWLARVADLMGRLGDEELIAVVLDDPAYRAIDPVRRASIKMCVRGAILTLRAEAA